MRRLLRVLGAVLLEMVTLDARAGEPSSDPQAGPLHPVTDDDDPHDEFEAFPAVVPHDRHWVRAILETGGVIVIGFVDYLLNTGARGGLLKEGDEKWALRYDWPRLRGKFEGSAYELDANRFGTNFVGHPFAGWLYFQVGRSNHLTFAESALFAFASSATWEYFGEIRERISVNDLIVTPAAGIAIGEATMQVAGFLERGRRTFAHRAASFLLAPVKFVNDLTDGVEPRRSARQDGLGLATEPYHRFELYAGGALTLQDGTSGSRKSGDDASYGDLRFGLDLSVVNLPGYDGAGRHARLFDDGNVASVAFTGAVSGAGLVDGLFATRVLPVGFYHRDARLDARGRLVGHGTVVGLRLGFEYGVHDYDRDRRRPRDLVSVVSPIGIAAEHTVTSGRLRVRTGIDVQGAMAGVAPYALADHVARSGGDVATATDRLATSIRNNGYYHALGIAVSPRVEIAAGDLSLEARLRIDNFQPILGLDEDEARVDDTIRIADRRSVGRLALGWEPEGIPLRIAAGATRSIRTGQLGAARASRGETSYGATIGARF